VFAVAVTIAMLYIAIGFALQGNERARQSQLLADETKSLAAFAITPGGKVSPAFRQAVRKERSPVLIVDVFGDRVFGDLPVPPTVGRILAGSPDSGKVPGYEYYGLPIIRNQHLAGGIYLSHPLTGGGIGGASRSAFEFVTRHWWQLLLAGAIAAAIALALARYLARGLTQPLRDMAQAAQRMATGDYRQRVQPKSRDELGQLALAFNRMAGQMEGLERLRRDLVANVSHELKTPISALRAHLENLLDGVEEPNPSQLQVMLGQSERLSRLVDQLLDLSRIESGDVPLSVEPLNLRALIDRVAREVEVARPERRVDMRNDVPEAFPLILADGERLHQVLFNLLDNAFRFTPAGGTVAVAASRADGFCQVQVRDTGPGIPEAHQGLVFERFYRVDPSRSREDGGTGIGLAIARSLVEAHGGQIWAEDAPGGGAMIRFTLPAEGPATTNGGRDDSAKQPALAPTSRRSG